MKKHKKIKNLYNKKLHYIFLFIIFLFILIIIVYKPDNYKNKNYDKHVHYVNDIIRDASYHLKLDEEYKKDSKLRKQLNEEIDKEFFAMCNNKEILNFFIWESCNYDDAYHYAESKILLNNLNKTTKDILIKLLKNSYEENKEKYIKEYLSASDNKWTHILLTMEMLDILNKSEERFWVKQFSNMKLNDSQPLFPQTWNRVWLFRDLGINNYKNLKGYGVEDINQICNYKPTLQDALQQNIFREITRTMINKYMIVRNFCGQLLTSEEKENLCSYFKDNISCDLIINKFNNLY